MRTLTLCIVMVLLVFSLVSCSGVSRHQNVPMSQFNRDQRYDSRSDSVKDLFSSSGVESAEGFPLGAGGTDVPNQKPYDLTFYESYGVNPFISTEDEKTSTFGMDVDTGSYTISRYYLNQGNKPEKESVRTEEYINYFKHGYPQPEDGQIFSIACEGAESEFGRPNYHLLKIGVKAKDLDPDERPPANMVFVVDVSGSMAREDRLEQVKRSLTTLAGSLIPGDMVGLVVYGSRGKVISELTDDHKEILAAIRKLKPEGATNAEEGLRLAYGMAKKNYEEGKINRIILCSDGVANVGNTGADEILAQVKKDANKGITLTAIGFGMGNYNDVLMEKLADHGDGMYYYIDSEAESDKVFGDGAIEMLMLLASDAKVQVEFNPDVVDRFRLLGYENRHLEKEDFRDDSVDAGEIGVGQNVTALYEVRIKEDATNEGAATACAVRVRYQDYWTKKIEEYEKPVTVAEISQPFNSATPDFRFTASVAEFAEILKESYWAKESSLNAVAEVAEQAAAGDDQDEFVKLVKKAISLEDKSPKPVPEES